MKKIYFVFLSLTFLLLSSCASVKVLNSWKSEDANNIKERNILVIARTSNMGARVAFEKSIADQLRRRGLKATESFTKFPKLNPDLEMNEEREKLIRDILGYEGFDAVCISVIKDYTEETNTHYYGGYYVGGNYSMYYPAYYGGFYSYYMNPYSYSTFGNYYVPGGEYTTTEREYILETLFYNLNKKDNDQLLAVVTSRITNPKDAVKTADEYTEKIAESLSNK